MRELHDRMPVILGPDDFARWIDPGISEVEELQKLLCPAPTGLLIKYPVNPVVNNSRVDDPQCVERVAG